MSSKSSKKSAPPNYLPFYGASHIPPQNQSTIPDQSSPPRRNGHQPTRPPSSPSSAPAQYRKATKELGALTVEVGTHKLSSQQQAWSSWWYPLRERELTQPYHQRVSTLQKYDHLVYQLSGANPQSHTFQNQYYSSMNQPEWAGLCDARAFAASLHPEPQRSAFINGICFTPKDLKALLILSYSLVDADKWHGVWGQPSTGSSDTFAAEDIFPDDFLKLLFVELGQKKKNLLFDSDPGVEVWTETINSAVLTISKTAAENKVSARLLLHTPSYKLSLDEKQSEITKGIGIIDSPFIYTFDLHGRWQGSQFIVERGEWTGDSVKSHPDFAIQLPDSPQLVNRDSANTRIQNQWIDHILELAQRSQPCRNRD